MKGILARGVAAVFSGPGQPITMRELSLDAVAPGSIVVRVEVCNVCGTDVHAWQGEFDTVALGGRLPSILGHEMMGRVEHLEGVTTDSLGQPLHPGDRVTYAYFRHCGRCRACLRGATTGCSQRWMAMLPTCEEPPYFIGGFSQFFCLPPGATVIRLPDTVPDELAAGANCALSQVIYGLHRSELRFGERVVIQGAGGLGLFAAAVAREMGAAQIIVVDAVAERLKLAVRFGADEVVDINEFPAPADRIRQIRRRTDGGADVVLGVAGIGPAFTEGIDMTGTTGRMVEIGIIDLAARVELAPAKLTYGNRQVIGVSLYEPWALERAVHFLADAAGRYPFDALATVPYPLAKLEQALADAAERKVQRPSIRPWS